MSGQRVLPHNLDAEKSVLGGILLRNESINQIENIVEDDFYDPRNKAVFAAMRILEDKAKPIDPVTLEEELARVGKLDAIGGMSYLSELAIAVPTADNISHYAEIVTDKSTARKLMLASSDIAAKGYGDYGEITDYLDEAEQKIFEITQRNQRGGAESIKSLLVSLFKDLGTRQTDGIAGVPTYFNDLDKKTAGLHPSDLVILAARPAMGKTSLALSIAHNCAMQGGWPVLVFSLEMSSLQLTERMLCSEARIEAFALRAGMLNRQHMSNLTFAANRISAAPIYIDDTPALSLREARAKARRWVGNKEVFKDKDHGLIVVDYLQLMRGNTSNKNSNREQEISEISRGLKSLAKELNCPVLALSQLNRGVEQRDDKRPRMSDLRECVTGDTLVCLADGRRVPIETLVGQTPTVLAMSPEGRIAPAESDKVWHVGRRPVFDVALASGRRIRATAKHRLYGAAGWQRVSQLQAGDRLAIARAVPEPVEVAEWPDERVILLGQLIGDGSYLSGQPMRYTTNSEDNSRAVQEAATAGFGVEVKRYRGQGTWHQLLISGNGNRWKPAGVNRWLRELGIFGQRSHEKRIPTDAFRLGRRQIALLLRHLWATDGCIWVSKGERSRRGRIYYSTTSLGLASDIAALLLRLGIVARIKRVEQGTYKTSHHVDVSGAEQQLRFLDVVGAFGPRVPQAEALKSVLDAITVNTNVDTLPNELFARVRR